MDFSSFRERFWGDTNSMETNARYHWNMGRRCRSFCLSSLCFQSKVGQLGTLTFFFFFFWYLGKNYYFLIKSELNCICFTNCPKRKQLISYKNFSKSQNCKQHEKYCIHIRPNGIFETFSKKTSKLRRCCSYSHLSIWNSVNLVVWDVRKIIKECSVYGQLKQLSPRPIQVAFISSVIILYIVQKWKAFYLRKRKNIFVRTFSPKVKSPINEGCIIISYKVPDEW